MSSQVSSQVSVLSYIPGPAWPGTNWKVGYQCDNSGDRGFLLPLITGVIGTISLGLG